MVLTKKKKYAMISKAHKTGARRLTWSAAELYTISRARRRKQVLIHAGAAQSVEQLACNDRTGLP